MRLHKLTCHAGIVGLGVLLILTILDGFNPTMEYLTSRASKGFIYALIGVSLIGHLMTLRRIRAGERKRGGSRSAR